MQNQHTKPREKLAFEEPWIHHHSGGLMTKKKKRETVIISHSISRNVTEVVRNVKNKTHISICNYKNMLL
jgi:hypothetical protein